MVFQYCFSFRPCCEQPMPFSLFFSLVVTHSFLLSVCLTSLPAADKISIFINVFKYLDWALQNVFLKISAFLLIFTFLHELWGFICSSSLAFWRRKLLVLTWLKENIHYSCACTRDIIYNTSAHSLKFQCGCCIWNRRLKYHPSQCLNSVFSLSDGLYCRFCFICCWEIGY